MDPGLDADEPATQSANRDLNQCSEFQRSFSDWYHFAACGVDLRTDWQWWSSRCSNIIMYFLLRGEATL